MHVSFWKRLIKLILWWPASPFWTRLLGEFFWGVKGIKRNPNNLRISNIRNILIVRLDEIGDVVLTSPFLRELRRNFPQCWITLIVKPYVYNLVELCPYVNEVLIFDWSAPKLFGALQRQLRALYFAQKYFWSRNYELAILPRWDVDIYHGSFLVYLSGAFMRVGYSENVNSVKKKLNSGFDKLFTIVFDEREIKHEVERGLDIIRFIGGEVKENHLELWTSQQDEAFAEYIIKTNNVKKDILLVGFGPGASLEKKNGLYILLWK